MVLERLQLFKRTVVAKIDAPVFKMRLNIFC